MKPPTELGEADGAAVCMWFGTNRITELVDLPFQHVRSSTQIVDGQSQRRAVFYKRNSVASWGAYIVDHERIRGTAKNLCGGAARFAVSGGITATAQEFDCACYVVETGERAIVASSNEGIYSGLNFSMAPILFRWVGGNVGAQGDPGQPEFKDILARIQLHLNRL